MKIKKFCFSAFAILIFNVSSLYAAWSEDHIVISEIATGSSASAKDEFVELYNPTSSSVDISGWKVQYSAADNGVTFSAKQTIDAGTILPAYQYYLVANIDGYSGGNADALNGWSYGILAAGGHMRLVNSSSEEIDRVGWGTAISPETTVAPEHESTQLDGSIERKVTNGSTQASMESGADQYLGNGEDSEDNSEDFIIRTARDPQSLSDGTVEPEPPPVPTGLSVTDEKQDGTLKVVITPDSYSGTYDYFKIYRGITDVSTSYHDQTPDAVTLTYWDSTSVLENVTYYYQISAMSTASRNNESEKTVIDEDASAFSTDLTPPDQITGLTAVDTGVGGEVRLDWIPSSAADISLYRIGHDSEEIGAEWGSVSSYTISGLGKSSTTVVIGLTNDTKRYFRISGIDFNGNEGTLSVNVSTTPTDIYPPAPVEKTYLTAENEGSGTIIILSWANYSPPSDLAHYKVYYSTYELPSPYDVHTSTYFAEVPAGTKTKNVTGLIEDVKHWFMVTGVDNNTNEQNELPSTLYMRTATPSDSPPEQITTLSALNTGQGGEVSLSWTASSASDINGYNIYRASYSVALTTSNYEYKCFVSTPGATETVTGLTNYVTYYFGLTAVDEASQEGVISSTVSVIPTDTVPPSAPSGISVIKANYPGNGGALKISWTNPSEVDFSSVTIYRSTSGLESPSYIDSSTSTTYTDIDLENGTTYYYILRSIDETGNEDQNTDIYSGRPLDSYAPSALSDFAGYDVGDSTQVILSWTANTDNDFRYYVIERDSAVITTLSEKNTTCYTDTVPSAGTTYYYEISVWDFSDNKSSSAISVPVYDVTAQPPSNIACSYPYSGGEVELNWENPENLRGIRIYRAVEPGTTSVFSVIYSTLIPPATYYADTGVTDGTTYYYGVRTFNYLYADYVFNESTNTDVYSVRPLDPDPPSAAQNFTAADAGNGGEVLLSWTANTEVDFRIYSIQRASAVITTLSDKNTTFYVDASTAVPVGGATYYYEISALDYSDNVSTPSAVSVFVKDIAASPPLNITVALPVCGGKVDLNWENPSALKGVRIYRSQNSATVFSVLISTLIPPATFYMDTGLTNKTTYYYGVRTINYLSTSTYIIYESTNTDVYPAFPEDTLNPETPSGFKVMLSTISSSLLLTWVQVSSNTDGSACADLAGYEIKWGTEEGNLSNTIDINSPQAVQRLHSSLSDGVTYYYKIGAKDSSGNYSVWSGTVSKWVMRILTGFEIYSDGIPAASFTPNGDGIADGMEVFFVLNEDSENVEISVFDKSGEKVRELFSSTATLFAVYSGSVTWDGKNEDGEIVSDGNYEIRLSIDGDVVEVKTVQIKGTTASGYKVPVFNNYPNPFIMSEPPYKTNIRFKLAQASPVKIAIYNCVGMLVKTWKLSQAEVAGSIKPGTTEWYEIPWDGRNGRGNKVSSGIYICHITGGGIDAKTKIAIIR
ncbi:MAG: lamin tail domain-containing protein [bacterium]